MLWVGVFIAAERSPYGLWPVFWYLWIRRPYGPWPVFWYLRYVNIRKLTKDHKGYGSAARVFSTTFNTILATSWRPVLLVEETGVPGENHWPVSRVTDKLYHPMWYHVHPPWVGFKLTMLVVIGTDCIAGCKSNYHMITTMTAT